jgi:hypothetical protein
LHIYTLFHYYIVITYCQPLFHTIFIIIIIFISLHFSTNIIDYVLLVLLFHILKAELLSLGVWGHSLLLYYTQSMHNGIAVARPTHGHGCHIYASLRSFSHMSFHIVATLRHWSWIFICYVLRHIIYANFLRYVIVTLRDIFSHGSSYYAE